MAEISIFSTGFSSIMLSNRSRTVTTRQTLMADHSNISSFFLNPRFRAFTSKNPNLESDFALISPTSVLDTKPSFPPFNNSKTPISCQEPTKNPKTPKFQSPEKSTIGLADLVNSSTIDDQSSKPINKKVLFGSKLRVQIPPADFGTKTKSVRCPGQKHGGPCVQTEVLKTCMMPVSEMELSEDYTCVISHGSNPKTTHIFDNCVVVLDRSNSCVPDKAKTKSCAEINSFLSFCFTCKKNLDHNQDIYIYRGEKAFCSDYCRYQEMLIDEMES